MTNEEIREIRRRHVEAVFVPSHFDDEDGFEQYKNAAHFAAKEMAAELLSKAYEEAAALAESPCPDRNCCGPGVAAAIRALKDSLVQELVAST